MTSPASVLERRRAGRWLAAWVAMVFLIFPIGAATRLTDSGLSITEWRPVTGIVPPLSEADWQAEFAKYRQIPEYQQVKRGMTLAEFKGIFLWEFVHRLWARLVGLALFVGLAVFLVRGQLDAAHAPPAGGLLLPDRPPGRHGLVHGEERALGAHRRQPVPARSAPLAGLADLRARRVDRAPTCWRGAGAASGR